MPWRPVDRRVGRAGGAGRVGRPPARAPTRPTLARRALGTAATLRALNEAHGETFYDVAAEAEIDEAAADAAFAAHGPVIDVQTHLVRPSRSADTTRPARCSASCAWSTPIAGPSRSISTSCRRRRGPPACSAAARRRSPCSRRRRAVPGRNVIDNADIAAAREIIDRYAGTGRVLGHTIVHPNLGPDELDAHGGLARRAPARRGGRCTRCGIRPTQPGRGWFLDDERCGIPFLERVATLGPRIVCAHKGIAGPIPSAAPAAASPRDIGPAAAAVPRHPVRRVPLRLRPRPAPARRARTPTTRPRREPPRHEPGRRRDRPGSQRVGRARLDLVPDAAPAARGRARPGQAAARRRPRPHPVGHRLGLVRPAAVADRRLPGVHHPRVDAGAVRLSGAHPRRQARRSSAPTPPGSTASTHPPRARIPVGSTRPGPSWRPAWPDHAASGQSRVRDQLERSSRRRAVPPRNRRHRLVVEVERPGLVDRALHREPRVVAPPQHPTPPASTRPCTAQRRVEVPRRVGRARQVEPVPLAHVVDEQLLVGMAHVGADDRQLGEVDEHVLEQLGVLHPGAHPRDRARRR